jgi:outer membrane protein assembly factor BamB
MKNGRIYIYRHGSYLACLNTETGKEIWRKTPDTSPELFETLGSYLPRQGAMTNWRTTSYVKCSDEALYFAGPSVGKLLAVSAEDGAILWQHPYNNFQLVLREDGLYAISGQYDKHPSFKFDPLSGKVLATIDTRRRACARPNGSCDAIFFRAEGGSVRLDLASDSPGWVSPMRAQCHDGVTIANGLLYWWPSVCDCQNTLYGVTCLGPAGDFDFSRTAVMEERLQLGPGDITEVTTLEQSENDWPTFRANHAANATTGVALPKNSGRLWWYNPDNSFTPTAPVTAGGLAFIGGSDGTVRALEMETGNTLWKAYTGGSVRFPPTVWEGRLFVGSGDGWMYVFEAASGRLLWRFNAAPTNRIIPVYGSLTSTWPVNSGVLVKDGVAYFAAGIVNYDGTHVYALNARTGSIVWQNNTSGHLESEARTGVSVQGHLLIDDGRLYLAGGTSVSPAIYDLKDGSCLNDPTILLTPGSTAIRGRDLYKLGDKVVVSGRPLYADPKSPVYDTSVINRVLHTSGDGRDIVWVNSQKLMAFPPIPNSLLNSGVVDPPTAPAFRVTWGKLAVKEQPLWERNCSGSVAFVRCKNAVLLAGAGSPGAALIEAVDIKSGKRFWRLPRLLPGAPVPWGLAVDAQGRVVVVLENGAVVCYGSAA